MRLLGALGMPEFWPSEAKWQLRRIAEWTNGRYGASDLENHVANGTLQAWAVYLDGFRGLILTEIILYPRLKALNIFGLAGEELASWMEMAEEELTAYAKAHGCAILEAGGRLGWKRRLPHWRHVRVSMERRVA